MRDSLYLLPPISTRFCFLYCINRLTPKLVHPLARPQCILQGPKIICLDLLLQSIGLLGPFLVLLDFLRVGDCGGTRRY